jgi:hypothetical protein
MRRDTFGARRLAEPLAQQRRHRMRHRDVRDQAAAEERALALVRAVDELVDQHERARRQFLLERAAGRQRNEVGDAGALEDVDIGAVIDVGRRQPVALVVARQKHDRQAVDLADPQRPRRLAPRAFDALLAHLGEARQVVNAGAADDAEHGFRHVAALPAPLVSKNKCPAQGRASRIHGRPYRGQALSSSFSGWAFTSAHTFFLVKYSKPASTIRNTIT